MTYEKAIAMCRSALAYGCGEDVSAEIIAVIRAQLAAVTKERDELKAAAKRQKYLGVAGRDLNSDCNS